MKRSFLPALAFLAAMAAPAFADDPGPGGERPPKPVGGSQIYVYYCQACHMADAKGATGAGTFPALASNPRLGSTAYAVSIIEKGRGGMPWFSDLLTPSQVAEVATYLRGNFGNSYPAVMAAEVLPFAKPPTSSR